MNRSYGPWATLIVAGATPQLSTFWRRRLTKLVPVSRTNPAISAQSVALLIAVAVSVLLLPTLRLAPARAEQPPAAGAADKKITGYRVQGSFADGLEFLQNLDVQKVGRDVLVDGYERLLKEHPRQPDRAKAMLALATLWQVKNPALSIKPDPAVETRWLREACKSAAASSGDWFEARFRLVGAIYEKHPDESRQILDDMMHHAPDSVVKVRSLFNKQMIAVDQHHFQEAEAIFLRLQNWDIESKDMPTDLFNKGKVFEQIQDSAGLMMMQTAQRRIPKAERKAKIEGLLEKCRVGRQSAERIAEAALQYMDHVEKLINDGRKRDAAAEKGTAARNSH